MKRKNDPPPPREFRPAVFIRWAVLVSAFIGLWFALNFDSLGHFFAARVQRNENRREVSRLERQISELEEEKRQLDTFGFSAEKTIRERYKMVRPGERVIVIDELPQPRPAAPPVVVLEPDTKPSAPLE